MLQLPLQYGPYEIGFKYHCIFDENRFYQTSYPNKQTTLRPIPLNIWYPAKKNSENPNMYYRDYWEFKSKDSCLEVFHQRLKNYNIEKAALYSTGKEAADRTPADKQHFQQLQQSRVKAKRNAPKIEQAFPIVVYHQGLSAHIEDNVLLLEYLASWGYVVVNSCYHSMNAKKMDVDWDLERSIKDIEAILHYQKRQFNVKDDQIALIGHSFGAQAVLGWISKKQAKFGNRFKAAVLLDSTIDYDFYKKNSQILELFSHQQSHFQVPLLVFARLSATFNLLNQLQSTNRYYCKIGHLYHNDFISIGATAAAFRSQNSQDDFATIWQNYQQICVFIHHFLDAFVKNKPKSQRLFEGNYFEKLSTNRLQCERLQPEESQRTFEPYPINSPKAPTFEQLVDLLQREGMSVFYDLHRRFPNAPIFANVGVEELGEYFLEYLNETDLGRELMAFFAGHSAA